MIPIRRDVGAVVLAMHSQHIQRDAYARDGKVDAAMSAARRIGVAGC